MPSVRTDGAARGDAEFIQTIPSRDRGRRSQTKVAIPTTRTVVRDSSCTPRPESHTLSLTRNPQCIRGAWIGAGECKRKSNPVCGERGPECKTWGLYPQEVRCFWFPRRGRESSEKSKVCVLLVPTARRIIRVKCDTSLF